MYCVNCGIKLADAEEKCPLCGVKAYHPELPRKKAQPLYPQQSYPEPQVSSKGALIIVTTMFLLPMLITLLCDLQISGTVTWSGFVVGGLLVAYVMFVLPYWFSKPNPAVFVPCSFVAIELFLLYIDLATGGSWFLTFAFPLVSGIGLIVTAVVVLLRYIRRGRLYIFGGANIALGLLMPLAELFSMITFQIPHFTGWSLYPLITLVLLGGMLIFLAIHRPAREAMERKFFL